MKEFKILPNLPSNYDRKEKDSVKLYSDVIQGSLGDCYFLCALCSFAEFPELAKSLFSSTTINPNGIFECSLYFHGNKFQICIDDYFPFREIYYKDKSIEPSKPKLEFASFNSRCKNLWVAILEKCWAKVHGSYYGIAKGLVSDAFEVLLPCPIETYPHHLYADQLWNIIKTCDESKYLICADIADDESDPMFAKKYDSMGLVTNHAYTLLEAR